MFAISMRWKASVKLKSEQSSETEEKAATEKTRSVVTEEQGQEGRKETGLALLPDSVV